MWRVGGPGAAPAVVAAHAGRHPGLATSWSASPDQRTWTFDLREDATLHDGTEVTAEQVVASLERARTQEGTPLTTVPFRAVRTAGERVEVRSGRLWSPTQRCRALDVTEPVRRYAHR